MNKLTMGRYLLAFILVGLWAGMSHAAIPADTVTIDAETAEPFDVTKRQYETVSETGDQPGPWQAGAWADGAVFRAQRIADAGDGEPAIRLVNVEGRPSGMFKPWTKVALERGQWTATVQYRKAGASSGRLAIGGIEPEARLDLPPTGEAFRTAALTFDVPGDGGEVQPTLQLYSGVGEGEALDVRRFELARVGAVSAQTKAAEQADADQAMAEAQAAADREKARRAAERKPIGDWVRPPHEPVPMAGPLTPPPVTGQTYHVATDGSNEMGDGSIDQPWRTIQHGMHQLHPGDRLYIRGGEYREGMLSFARSGRPDAYITVAGYPGETVKIISNGSLAVFNLSAGSRWTPLMLEEQAYLVIRDLFIDAGNSNNAFRIHGPMMLDEYKGNLAKSRGLRHNIWIVGNEIVGGNGKESLLGAAYGAHDIIISNNIIHDAAGINAFVFGDGTIIEWNTLYNMGRDSDDAGAIKSMSPGNIIRYNTLFDNYRSSTSTKPGWAPRSRGGEQWRFLQGVTGIYLDWAQVSDNNNDYPQALIPEDPANYVYGNRVVGSNAGIYVYRSRDAQVFDNVVHGNGRNSTGGWVEGKPGSEWLPYIGPAGNGIAVTKSDNVKVYRNIAYDNEKAGISSQEAPGLQAFNNVLFGNDLAQIHLRKQSDTVAFGHNMIIAMTSQGAPFRHLEQDFGTPEAFRNAYPHQDAATQVVRPEPGESPLMLAERLLRSAPSGEAAWRETHEALTAKTRQAGVGMPQPTVPQAAYDPTGGLQEPMPWTLPGLVEAENYDVGGTDVSYHDTTTQNQGGHYRGDDVDIKESPSASNGAVVGFTDDGEWLEYTVDVEHAGQYPVTLTYATPESSRRVSLTLNGEPIGQPLELKPTSSWDALQSTSFGALAMPKGVGVLRLTVDRGPVDLDRIEFAAPR